MVNSRELDLKRLHTYTLKERGSKVNIEAFAGTIPKGGGISDFLSAFPDILAARDLDELAQRVVMAFTAGENVLVAMGAHVIKVGLAPILVQLMEKGVISALSINGACLIHDSEIAMIGETSEDVAAQLSGGRFGMAEETALLINDAMKAWRPDDLGFGNYLGGCLARQQYPYLNYSLLANAYRLQIPVSVHIAPGTDIIHMHASAEGEAIGRISLHDFRLFASWVAALEEGVFINIGSAVLMPEIFLKAVSLAGNLGYSLNNITTATMDFIRQYRASENVVSRPTLHGGQGFYLIGHHEIMLPLLAVAILDKLGDQ